MSAAPTCPRCDADITGTGLNAAADQAACQAPGCGWTGSLSGLRLDRELGLGAIAPDAPPPRCTNTDTPEGFRASIPAAKRANGVVFLIISVVWNALLLTVAAFYLDRFLLERGVTEQPLLPFHDTTQPLEKLPPEILLFLIPFFLIGIGFTVTWIWFFFGRLVMTADRDTLRMQYRVCGLGLPGARSLPLDELIGIQPRHRISSTTQVNGRSLETFSVEFVRKDRPPVKFGAFSPKPHTAWLIVLLRDRLLGDGTRR